MPADDAPRGGLTPEFIEAADIEADCCITVGVSLAAEVDRLRAEVARLEGNAKLYHEVFARASVFVAAHAEGDYAYQLSRLVEGVDAAVGRLSFGVSDGERKQLGLKPRPAMGTAATPGAGGEGERAMARARRGEKR